MRNASSRSRGAIQPAASSQLRRACFAELCERPGSLPFGAQVWGDTSLPLPWLAAGAQLRDVLSGRLAVIEGGSQGVRLPVGELLTAFPVALLEYSAPSATEVTENTENSRRPVPRDCADQVHDGLISRSEFLVFYVTSVARFS